MKNNYWLILLALISTSLAAQELTNAPAPLATNAPALSKTNPPAAKADKKKAKKPEKKVAAKKKDPAKELKTVPLLAGSAMVIASNVNVRGQAKLNSEVVTRLNKGQEVSVLEEVTLKKSGPDEPSAWAKIILPAKVHVWVNASFIDSTNKTVVPRKLKLRAGPGEDNSVLGIMKQGDPVQSVGTKGDWMEIEAPAEACGFVAAQYLKQEPPGSVAIAAPEPAPVAATVTDPLPIGAPPTNAPDVAAVTNAPASATETPPADEPPPKRIVEREGLVRGTFSIQAPTRFELISAENHKTINYLHTTSSSLDLQRYKGMHIIVTGEESLDERWKNTPVITIQRIQVVE